MIAAALAFIMTVCGSSTAIAASELTAESKPATQYTIDANQEVYALLDFEDTAEFENATKGLIASPDTLDIYDENGKLVWSQTAYAFPLVLMDATEISATNTEEVVTEKAPVNQFIHSVALAALAELGANTVEVALYPKIEQDADGNTLTEEKSYILHFEAYRLSQGIRSQMFLPLL